MLLHRWNKIFGFKPQQLLPLKPMYFFFVECADGFYNKNCSGTCGFCRNDEVCNKVTGYCINGCKSNYKDPFCQGNSFIYEYHSRNT